MLIDLLPLADIEFRDKYNKDIFNIKLTSFYRKIIPLKIIPAFINWRLFNVKGKVRMPSVLVLSWLNMGN